MGRKKIQISRITDERNRQVREGSPGQTKFDSTLHYIRYHLNNITCTVLYTYNTSLYLEVCLYKAVRTTASTTVLVPIYR